MSQTAHTLGEWIAVATAGLPPSAVSKVAAEIADHAAEARHKFEAEGMSADEADQAALLGLGDARQVAISLRDAHFSRRQYTRGGVAILALLAFTGLRLALSDFRQASPESAAMPWLLWGIACFLGSGILTLLVARAALVFLQEQYDIPTPRLGWWLFVASLILNMAPAVLSELIRVTNIYDYYTPTLARVTSLGFWYNPHPALMAVNQFGEFASWILIGGFCIRQLLPEAHRASRALSLLLILGGIIGVETLLMYGTAIGQTHIPGLNYVVARYRNVIVWMVTAPYYALDAMLLGLFIYMRRPGAAVAG